MKIGNIFTGLLITAGIIVTFSLLHAQQTAASVQNGAFSLATLANEDVSGLSDFEVELKALELLPTIPAARATNGNNFYTIQHSPESAEPWPPLPANLAQLPAWQLGGGFYLLDDRDYIWGQRKKSKRVTTLQSSGGVHAMDAPSAPGDGDGGDDDDDYSGSYITPFSTNGLWLQITTVSNGLAYLNLMNATDSVYEILSAVTLTNGSNNWNIESEVWPTNTVAMPFTVPELGRTNTLFIRAMDWTGIDANSNGIADWWEWKYFGNFNQASNADYDGDGVNNYNEFANHTDPNNIRFSIQFTNNYVNTSPAYGAIAILGGVPSYEAILVNDTNLADAIWQPYSSSSVMASLNSGDGNYNVMVGLKGLPSDAAVTWLGTQLTLNTIPPTLAVTNPVPGGTVSVPMIQLQGIADQSLGSLTFDVSNALGVVTNQAGYWQPAAYDTNRLDFTTNTFQCYDVALTNGVNVITLHATDLAGNNTTTNFSYTLSYAGVTNAPVLSVIWPAANTAIGGSNVTIQAQVDDATANISASVNGNTVQALVERSGLVWLQNLPLNSGTNTITITATNAAGNASTNTLNVVESTVSLSIDPISSDQLNQSSVTVSGTVSDGSYNVWVNGIEATLSGTNWEADGVSVSPTGTSSITVQAGTDLSHIIASQTFYQAQPATVELMNYSAHVSASGQGMYGPYSLKEDDNWTFLTGGNQAGFLDNILQYNVTNDTSWANSFAAGEGGFDPTYVGINDFSVGTWENKSLSFQRPWSSGKIQTQTKVMIQPPGQQSIGQSALYLVMAQVINEDTDLQLAASAVRFVNQLAGTASEDVTNSDGVWTTAMVCVPAGVQPEVTPIAPGNIDFSEMKLSPSKIVYFSVDPANMPSSYITVSNQVEPLLQLQLSTNVFDSPPAGHSVQVKVNVEATPSGKPGPDGSKTSYFNRVDWTSFSIPSSRGRVNQGKIHINDGPIEQAASQYSRNISAQTWVNILAHEGIWGNAGGNHDCIFYCTDGDISSGALGVPAYLFDEYIVTPYSRTTLRNEFGF